MGMSCISYPYRNNKNSVRMTLVQEFYLHLQHKVRNMIYYSTASLYDNFYMWFFACYTVHTQFHSNKYHINLLLRRHHRSHDILEVCYNLHSSVDPFAANCYLNAINYQIYIKENVFKMRGITSMHTNNLIKLHKYFFFSDLNFSRQASRDSSSVASDARVKG